MKEKNIYDFKENIFQIVGKDSALLTAGNLNHFNSMTISWATFGVLWGKNVIFCFVRPTRYTYNFMEQSDIFTVSFFEKEYKEILNYMGSHSGRDEDKVKKCNLKPITTMENSVTFEEARLTFVLKKIYIQDLDQNQMTEEVKQRNYPKGNYHRLYVGEIIQCLEK